MGKIDIRSIDFDDDEYYENEHYENIKRKRRKKNNNDQNFLEFQGESRRGRESDSFITQRTKGRSRR